MQVLCLSQPFPPHFSHFVQSLSWRARLSASRVFFTWLASSSPSRYTRSTCKRKSAPSCAPRQRRAHPCSPVAASPVPVPAVPFFVEPSSPGPDRVEVEVHSPPVAFPRGCCWAGEQKPTSSASVTFAFTLAKTLRANAAAGHARASAFSPRGLGLQRRLSPSPAPVHSRQRVCARCRQERGASHDSPAASAVNVSVEDGVVSRGMMTK